MTDFASQWRPLGDFGIVKGNEIEGGFHVFQTTTERNNMPFDRRVVGMWSYVLDENRAYILSDAGSLGVPLSDDDWGVVPGSEFSGFGTGVATIPARGSIELVDETQIGDGDYFDIDDGLNPVVRFEFDKNSSVIESATHRQIVLAGGETATQVRDLVRDKINSLGTLSVSAYITGSDTLRLENTQVSTGEDGNVAIVTNPPTPNWSVSGMAGALNICEVTVDSANIVQIDTGVFFLSTGERIVVDTPVLLPITANNTVIVYYDWRDKIFKHGLSNSTGVEDRIEEHDFPFAIVTSDGATTVTVDQDVRRACSGSGESKATITVGNRAFNGMGAMFTNVKMAIYYAACFQNSPSLDKMTIELHKSSVVDDPISYAEPWLTNMVGTVVDGMTIRGMSGQTGNNQALWSWDANLPLIDFENKVSNITIENINIFRDTAASAGVPGTDVDAVVFKNPGTGFKLRNCAVNGRNRCVAFIRWTSGNFGGHSTSLRSFPTVIEECEFLNLMSTNGDNSGAMFKVDAALGGRLNVRNCVFDSPTLHAPRFFHFDGGCTFNATFDGCDIRNIDDDIILPLSSPESYSQMQVNFRDCIFRSCDPGIDFAPSISDKVAHLDSCIFATNMDTQGIKTCVNCYAENGVTIDLDLRTQYIGCDFVTDGVVASPTQDDLYVGRPVGTEPSGFGLGVNIGKLVVDAGSVTASKSFYVGGSNYGGFGSRGAAFVRVMQAALGHGGQGVLGDDKGMAFWGLDLVRDSTTGLKVSAGVGITPSGIPVFVEAGSEPTLNPSPDHGDEVPVYHFLYATSEYSTSLHFDTLPPDVYGRPNSALGGGSVDDYIYVGMTFGTGYTNHWWTSIGAGIRKIYLPDISSGGDAAILGQDVFTLTASGTDLNLLDPSPGGGNLGNDPRTALPTARALGWSLNLTLEPGTGTGNHNIYSQDGGLHMHIPANNASDNIYINTHWESINPVSDPELTMSLLTNWQYRYSSRVVYIIEDINNPLPVWT